MKMTKAEKMLVKAAKKAMLELSDAMPCTPYGDAWDALYDAVYFTTKGEKAFKKRKMEMERGF